MTTQSSWTVPVTALAETQALGARIAEALTAGDVVLLRGELGAGKTELARAVVRARMGHDCEVPSPTFTLVQHYETPGLLLAHADLYRVKDPSELAELGLDEVLETGALLVEWPERAAGHWPQSRLEVALSLRNDTRLAALTGHGAWADRLIALKTHNNNA
ncbi:MAG TPA: tRNA (adenosine(37)-N6)-threonylcarbamoyltransferase complex ATPase subunit type 1 TsaE [Alphaproteobacteria bacterium]|nr:tRNA (adenosine(37)-N6)-threonylcarbamoyltransferase complex ATPase subunit type 1 TsaE [Alphaproteobacteria bacterium]HAJ46243.1 tRNA (adenosine(37)-N6)-threonylcarbamoyltransferase complex ATPase subunit type 1 TsaE [Alphaproteobacteria bacterium]